MEGKIYLKISVAWILLMILAGTNFGQVSETTNIRLANSDNFDANNIVNYFVNQDPDPVEPGEFVEVKWKVENLGSKNADNVIIRLIPAFPFSLEQEDDGIRKVGTVFGRQIGDEGVIIHYKLKVDENAVEGNNKINLKFSLDNGVVWNMFDPFYIRVQPRDIVLAVESVNSDPPIIKPGESTNLRIKLANMENSLIKNIKINLELLRKITTSTSVTYQEMGFSTVGSSNEKTIKDLKGKEKKEVEFKLIADPDIKDGVHKIQMMMAYSDQLGNNYSQTNLISLIVGDEPELAVSVENSEIKEKGTSGEVTIKFVNKGVSDIKFLYTQLEGSDDYEILSSDNSYIGNIDSDDYETADFKIFIHKSADSTVKLPLYLEYKDSNNNEYAIKKELELRLFSNSELKEYGIKKGSNMIGILIVLIIIVIGFFYYRYRKNKKKKTK